MKRNDNVFRMPALGLLLPLIASMILSGWYDAALGIKVLGVLLAVLSFMVSCIFLTAPKSLTQVVLFMAAGFGFMRSEVASTAFPLSGEQPLTATLLLTADPVEKGGRLLCDVLIVNVLESETTNQQNGISTSGGRDVWTGRRLQVYLPVVGSPDSVDAAVLRMGDFINARFIPRQPKNYSDGFDYASYLRNKGFTATAYITADRWRIAGNVTVPLGWRLRIKADRCRSHLIGVYEKYGIAGDRLALVSALSFGKKDLMDREVRDRFAAAGVAHVLAVSGMHVGIVYSFVNAIVELLWKCLFLLKKIMGQYLRRQSTSKRQNSSEPCVKRRIGLIIRQLLVVAVLWAYAFITGLPASVIRAVTMFTLSAGAVCLSRSSQTWNNLFLTALLMLCMRPSYLFDIGFQMSFTAVMAILLFLPAFEQLLGLERNDEAMSLFGGVVFSQFNCENTNCENTNCENTVISLLIKKVGRYVVSSLLISIAAQLGTAPLSIYYFHRYPQWFLLANLVLVPTAVALTWAALAFQCLAAIPIVPEAILSAAAHLLSAGLDFFTRFAFCIERLPGATVDGMMPSLGEIAVIYLLLICAFRYFQKKAYLYTLENLIRRIRCAKYGKYLKNR